MASALNSKHDNDIAETRREFAGKVAYVAPAVLAVIVASERPALAQSSGSESPT